MCISVDPASWSQLVLDEAFDPSSEEAQLYLAKFCTDLFDQEFASVVQSDYTCSMQQFDLWLQEQAVSAEPEAIYTEHCASTTSLPVPPENFNACMIGYTKLVGDTTVLARNGVVTVMYYPFMSRVRYVDFQDILDKEWNLIESWMNRQAKMAPSGINNFYFTSFDFWWYDTNGQMLLTTYGSAGIALVAAAAVVLVASRSFTLTFFSVFTIAYVLTSVTATLVSLGWTLGFLESICFGTFHVLCINVIVWVAENCS
jgi:protein dispatched 1